MVDDKAMASSIIDRLASSATLGEFLDGFELALVLGLRTAADAARLRCPLDAPERRARPWESRGGGAVRALPEGGGGAVPGRMEAVA